MDPFSRDDLHRLAEQNQTACASLYMPTFRAGSDVRQNATRFRNLINRVQARAAERFPDDQELSASLQEAAQLEADNPWWQHQSDGLAMFVSAARRDRYRVPVQFPEIATVGSCFHIRPLVKLVQSDGRFYVLAVSQNQVRLLEGTRHSVDARDAEELPSDLRSALNIDEYTNSLQQHSTGGPQASGTMMFHGHGAADMSVKKADEIRQFFHRLDDALQAYLNTERVPLVFAGVDYLFPIFRETSSYPYLVHKPVAGNPDDLSPDQLHRQAWPLVEPHFAQDRAAALKRFHSAANGPETTTQLTEIIRAAALGAVDTLLFAEKQQRWGVVDSASDQVQLVDEPAIEAEELVNYALVLTLTNGGAAYCVSEEDLPGRQPAAALLRFPLPAS